MADEERSKQLPKRVPGAAEGRPAPSSSPHLSQELRQKMQAAVSAERARTAGRDHEHAESAPGAIASDHNGVAAPSAKPVDYAARREPVAPPDPAVEPERIPVRSVTPEPAARPGPPAGGSVAGNPAPLLRGPPRSRVRKTSARRRLIATGAIATALILIAAGSLGVAVAKYIAHWPAQGDSVSPAEQRAEAAARRRTAAWVTQQVSHAAVVSCDPLMCAALTVDGFPSRNVRVLGPTSLPTSPLTSAVVVVTQAVRDLFGSSLSSDYAPAVLATFGSADASTTVRVIAPDGAAAYYRQLAADLNARKLVGADLVKIRAITLSAEAKQQLVAGQVDSRLMLAIAALATSQAIDILGFGNVGPGADATIPLRFADLAESDHSAHTGSSAYVRTLRANLTAVSPRFRPTTIVTVALSGRQTVLRIEFTAPSPLNLFTPPSS
jgi:hypothetical protein